MKTIRATIDPSGLDNIRYYFNGTQEDIVVELFQNARRAGATRIDVNVSPRPDGMLAVTVADDGIGIEDPQVLLTLWKSGRKPDAVEKDRPAGFGFFSLAGTPEVSVSSRDWSVKLTPDVFAGRATATPKRVRNPRKGTTVQFVIQQTDLAQLERAIMDVASGQTLDVTLDGRCVPTGNWFDELLYHTPGTVYKVRDSGLTRIGFAMVIHHRDCAVSGPDLVLNFHGRVIQVQNITRLFPTGTTHFRFVVDVIDEKVLNLMPPARRDVCRDELFDAFVTKLWDTALRTIACEQAVHTLPFEAYKYARARLAESDTSCVFPEASSVNVMRVPNCNDRGRMTHMRWLGGENVGVRLSDGSVRQVKSIRHNPSTVGIHTLRLLSENGVKFPLETVSQSMRGYSWYPEYELVNLAVEAVFDKAGLVEFPHISDFDYSRDVPVLEDIIEGRDCLIDMRFRLLVEGPEGRGYLEGNFTSPWILAFANLLDDEEERACAWMMVRDRIPDRSNALDAIVDLLFTASDDRDCDSTETQEKDFRMLARREFDQRYGTHRSAVEKLLAAIESPEHAAVRKALAGLKRVLIEIDPRSGSGIKVEVFE